MIHFETITTYKQVLDIPLEDLLDWFDRKVREKSDWECGQGPNPLLEFHIMSDPEDSTYVLFGDYFMKRGSLESAIREGIWREATQRMSQERVAYPEVPDAD